MKQGARKTQALLVIRKMMSVRNTGMILWSLLGLGLAFGLVWVLGSHPAAEAQVIDPHRGELSGPKTVDTSNAPRPSTATITEPHIRLEKNEGYYDVAGIVITRATSFFIAPNEAWTRYQAGGLDTIPPPGIALETIKGSPVYSPELHTYPQACTYYYGFSHDVPPFDDPLVRAAFASAIDRRRLIAEVEALTGDEFPALTFASPGSFGYVDGYSTDIGRPYSPTLAQSLLATSGYDGTPGVTLMFNTGSYHQAVAESVQRMWNETLGISVTLQAMEDRSYLDLLQNGSAAERPGVWRLSWCAHYPDANSFHNVFSGRNRARYENPTYDAVIQAAASETDPAQRLELYEQAEATLVMTDTAIAPLYYYVNHRLTRPDLNRTYRPFGGQHLDEWTFSGDVRPLEVAWGSPSALDPALSSNDYIEQLFLSLADVDEDGNAVPELATGWEVSADATVYTFTMRGDATWTDGNPVTAGDVEYGVLRSLDPATGSSAAYELYVIENARAYNEGNITDPNLVGVEALDSNHVRFILAEPAAYFPAVVGLPSARPQPQWAIETYGRDWTASENIVTNGPYKLVSWEGPPYLSISKSADGDPIAGELLNFEISYQNTGASPAENTVITDTMMTGLTYVSDTAPFAHTGSGAPGDPLVWDLGTVAAHSSGSFNVQVRVAAFSWSTVSNRVEIATSNPDDQGQPQEKEYEWSGHVEGPTMIYVPLVSRSD
jgi:uncharacterized repeat protein (TIGR01451 family)